MPSKEDDPWYRDVPEDIMVQWKAEFHQDAKELFRQHGSTHLMHKEELQMPTGSHWMLDGVRGPIRTILLLIMEHYGVAEIVAVWFDIICIYVPKKVI